MSSFICATLQVVLIITAVIVLCGFRHKTILSGPFDIGPTHSFCKKDKDVWIPRFYIWRGKNPYSKPNYEIAKYGSNYFFLYSGGEVHSSYDAYILSPHFVFISFLLNGLLNDVHIIAFSTAVAILISILLNPDFIFFTPLILLCTSFLGVQLSLHTLTPGYYETSLNISNNSKLQKKFVKPSYLFFSASSLMNELSILLLTMQAVCSCYRESGPLRVINLLCTCALLVFSIYQYKKNVPGFYKKNTKDVFILFAEMAILAIAIIIVNATASQVIHFKIAPTYIFLITVVLIVVVGSISSHILSIYVPSKSQLKRYQKKYKYSFQKKYSYQENKNVFPNYTFIESYKASDYKKYYLPKEELERIRNQEEQERKRKEKEAQEYLKLLEERAAKEEGLKKYRTQYEILRLKNKQHTKEASELFSKIKAEEQKIEDKRFQDSLLEAMLYRAKHATMWLGGERVTPEEYDQFCRRYGYGKYRQNPDSSDEIKEKEKKGGYVNDIDTNNATDRFNKRR